MTNRLTRTIGPGNIWTLGIGIGFLIWAILSVIPRFNVNGSPYLFIPGGILFIIAISNISAYRYNREKIISALKSYPRVNLETLANELRMKQKDIKEIIIDLRTEGRIKASFDPKSGDVIVLDVQGQAPVAVQQTSAAGTTEPAVPTKASTSSSLKAQGYCPYCGSQISSKDKYCNNCGSYIDD